MSAIFGRMGLKLVIGKLPSALQEWRKNLLEQGVPSFGFQERNISLRPWRFLRLASCSPSTAHDSRLTTKLIRGDMKARTFEIPAELRALVAENAPHSFKPRVRVQAFQHTGFTVNGSLIQNKTLLLLPNFGLTLPRVHSITQLCPESLAVLELLAPRPTMLLIGLGKTQQEGMSLARGVPFPFHDYLRNTLKIGYEIMSAPTACATFNVLCEEDRCPAAILVPFVTTEGSQ